MPAPKTIGIQIFLASYNAFKWYFCCSQAPWPHLCNHILHFGSPLQLLVLKGNTDHVKVPLSFCWLQNFYLRILTIVIFTCYFFTCCFSFYFLLLCSLTLTLFEFPVPLSSVFIYAAQIFASRKTFGLGLNLFFWAFDFLPLLLDTSKWVPYLCPMLQTV